MVKRSIFLKIYLSFWLTIVLALLVQVALSGFDSWRPLYRMRQRLEASVETTVAVFGQAALAYREAGKTGNTLQLAQRLKQESGIDVYLLDHAATSLDGRPVPPQIREVAQHALQSGSKERLRRDGVASLALPLPDSGGTFIAAGSYHRNSFLAAPLRDSGGRLLRWGSLLFSTGLVCYLLTRYLVSPLLVLKQATKRFADGDLTVRIGARIDGRRDETTDLAHDFDVMAERIESLVRLQRQLIGDVSHELRSPLARLNVALDLARQKAGPEAEHALNRIEEETQELSEMIAELLTLTRLESGDAPIEMATVHLAGLVREIAQDGDFEAQGSNRGVTVVHCEECRVNGGAGLLRRAVENVVRNAIYHTHENTEVEITLGRLGGRVQIQVRDHGPGVSERELADIFLPFYRASASRERKTGGAGLGLAIAQRAIRLHHGTVTASNAADGGLVVTFLL